MATLILSTCIILQTIWIKKLVLKKLYISKNHIKEWKKIYLPLLSLHPACSFWIRFLPKLPSPPTIQITTEMDLLHFVYKTRMHSMLSLQMWVFILEQLQTITFSFYINISSTFNGFYELCAILCWAKRWNIFFFCRDYTVFICLLLFKYFVEYAQFLSYKMSGQSVS